VHERFTSNPFSTQKPMENFGILKKDTAGELWFEQEDGNALPYVGPVLDFKDDDPERLRPELKHNGCVAQFDLSDEEDMIQYRALCQKFCEGRAILSNEEREYDNDIKSWRILIRWMEPFFGPPSSALRALQETIKDHKGQMPPPPEVKEMFPEDPVKQPEDLAKVTAKEDSTENDPETEQNNEETPARYGTVDEAIHAFGSLFGEDGGER
jgi:hypothetical protein